MGAELTLWLIATAVPLALLALHFFRRFASFRNSPTWVALCCERAGRVGADPLLAWRKFLLPRIVLCGGPECVKRDDERFSGVHRL